MIGTIKTTEQMVERAAAALFQELGWEGGFKLDECRSLARAAIRELGLDRAVDGGARQVEPDGPDGWHVPVNDEFSVSGPGRYRVLLIPEEEA